jgi:hypothetical protein
LARKFGEGDRAISPVLGVVTLTQRVRKQCDEVGRGGRWRAILAFSSYATDLPEALAGPRRSETQNSLQPAIVGRAALGPDHGSEGVIGRRQGAAAEHRLEFTVSAEHLRAGLPGQKAFHLVPGFEARPFNNAIELHPGVEVLAHVAQMRLGLVSEHGPRWQRASGRMHAGDA